MGDTDDQSQRSFVVEIGVALHTYGTPAHRLEAALTALAKRLGLEAQVFTTPTQLMMGFGTASDQRPIMVRVQPGTVSLGKLSSLDRVADAVVRGEVSAEEGVEQVRAIVRDREPFGGVLTVLAFTLTSAALARFFGGGIPDVVASAAIGWVIGVLALLFSRSEAAGQVFALVAAFVASAGATGAAVAGVPMTPAIAILAGLIVLVPGLTLTIAMTELATMNLVSGTARLMAAALIFLEMAFGVALGQEGVARAFGTPPEVAAVALPAWTEPVALLLAALSIGVLFQTGVRGLGLALVSCVLAFYGSQAGAELLGPVLGASVGAFLLAAASNTWARLADRPAMLMLVPGLLLLVPGSLGFRSVAQLVQKDVLAGVDTAFTMMLVSISLVAGLLVANAVVSPRRSL